MPVPVVATEVGTIVAPGTAGLAARTLEHEKVTASPAVATALSVMVRTVLVPEIWTAEPVTKFTPVAAPIK